MEAPRELEAGAALQLAIAGIDPTTWPYGDVCGCLDDRCDGYHHERGAQCACLPALIASRLAEHPPTPEGEN